MDVVTHSGSRERVGSSAADRLEPRALRTRGLILDALRDALSVTSIDSLSVTEVCRLAGVHRVTFYRHWPDVRAAATDAFAELIDSIAAVDELDTAAADSPGNLAAHYERALVAQLVAIRDQRATFRALAGSAGFSERLVRVLTARAGLAVRELVRLGVDVPGADSGIAAAHLAGGVVAASFRWAASEDALETGVSELMAQLPRWWPARS